MSFDIQRKQFCSGVFLTPGCTLYVVALLIQRILNFFTEIFTLFPTSQKKTLFKNNFVLGQQMEIQNNFLNLIFYSHVDQMHVFQQLQLTLLGCAVSVSLVPEEIKYLIKLFWIVELGSREEE